MVLDSTVRVLDSQFVTQPNELLERERIESIDL